MVIEACNIAFIVTFKVQYNNGYTITRDGGQGKD